MTSSAALQKLLVWLSPAFPVGSFAWSAGLETAIAQKTVLTRAALEDWIRGGLAHGGLWADAVLLAAAHREAENADALADAAALGLALIASNERYRETTLTADAFLKALAAWPVSGVAPLPHPCSYPVAIGWAARAHGIDMPDALLAFLTSAVHGQISVAVRLVPLGQTEGLAAHAALEPAIAQAAHAASMAPLAELGGIAYAADLAQMRHETLEPRIFRS